MAEQPLLKWNSVATADTYDVQVTDQDPALDNWNTLVINETGVLVTEFDADTFLAHATQYWWRARARNESGIGPWSTHRTFTAYQKPEAPAQVSPADATTGIEPATDANGNKYVTLDWSDALRADEYTLEVATSSDFSTGVQPFTGLTTSQHDFIVEPGKTYYWRVKATNPGGDSAWSSTWSFSVQATPDQVTLVSPSNGADVTIS